MSEAGQRRRWDHLIGRHYEEAREEIKRDKPDAVIETVPHDAVVTMDFRQERVRLFVDSDGKVMRAPQVG